MEQDVWAFWKNAPCTPLKVTEVNQIFLGGLKHVNNHLFAKKQVEFGVLWPQERRFWKWHAYRGFPPYAIFPNPDNREI